MSNYPTGAEHDPRAPYNETEDKNACLYCGEEIENSFCDSECEKAFFND